jgi:hypothetical protein
MTACQFDPAKALREEISGIADVMRIFLSWERRAEEKFAEAELQLHAIRKMKGFAASELDRKRGALIDYERRHKNANS